MTTDRTFTITDLLSDFGIGPLEFMLVIMLMFFIIMILLGCVLWAFQSLHQMEHYTRSLRREAENAVRNRNAALRSLERAERRLRQRHSGLGEEQA